MAGNLGDRGAGTGAGDTCGWGVPGGVPLCVDHSWVGVPPSLPIPGGPCLSDPYPQIQKGFVPKSPPPCRFLHGGSLFDTDPENNKNKNHQKILC